MNDAFDCELREFGCVTNHINYHAHHESFCPIKDKNLLSDEWLCNCKFKPLNRKMFEDARHVSIEDRYPVTIRDIAMLYKKEKV